ncbi:uncharacterized protein LOC109722523 [Ananas comosus]|uniref:Uncharacterized protein LOC109722523 n=1 Tax=Ananas comosus TaxID=4615 RepID=A0A6P5GDZ7_ANACO|nr:uncharacterized protein LOC109722523 [Ananas comosus]
MRTHPFPSIPSPPNLSVPSHRPHLLPFPTTQTLLLSAKNPSLRRTRVPRDAHAEEADLELLEKPSPVALSEEHSSSAPSNPQELEEVLAPFLKLFQTKDSAPMEETMPAEEPREEGTRRVEVEYYDPKPGDLVVGVVVSGNENKLDVSIGADMLGTMLTKEVLPLYKEEMPYLLCDVGEDKEEFRVPGKMGIVRDAEALSRKKLPGRPVVEVGTVLFSEVLGRTLSGRPLLSARRMFRRIAWHRVRQIMQLNEPIEVKIFEWNTGGLLTRIEGLRAFLPKAELMNRVNNFTDLKSNVGRRMHVLITRIDEATNDLIVSEKEAWDMMYLKEGTLLQGTVRKIFPYGAQVRIGETNRSGLLHISNITHSRVNSVSDVLKVGEEVKVLVIKSMFPDKIALSIADLESEPGLFLSNREKVFSEAEEVARKYRQRLPAISPAHQIDSPKETLPFDNEAMLYANWEWFKFEQVKEIDNNTEESL